jgi:hypothetical protein
MERRINHIEEEADDRYNATRLQLHALHTDTKSSGVEHTLQRPDETTRLAQHPTRMVRSWSTWFQSRVTIQARRHHSSTSTPRAPEPTYHPSCA